jgi:hypothetical protein
MRIAMLEEIKKVEEKLGYTFDRFDGKYYKFTKHYMRQKKKSYQSFELIECAICGKPYFKRRWTKSKAHNLCQLAVTTKTRKVRRDRRV